MRETAERSFVDRGLPVRRPSQVADAEGDVGPSTPAGTLDGTVGDPDARDVETAAAEGQRLDVMLSTSLDADVRVGDVVTARGRDWTVATVRDTRFLRRIGLREFG